MKVTITIEGKQGEGKTRVVQAIRDLFEDEISDELDNFNTYISDGEERSRRTHSSNPHSLVITTITTDGESR